MKLIGGIYKKIKTLCKNIVFSMKISWKASKKYFLLRLFFQLLMATVPSVIIYVNKLIIDILVEESGENKTVVFTTLITLLIVYIVVKIVDIFINKLAEIYTEMHQDLISNDINIELMNQINSLDISYFDSPKFYNESLNARIDSNALPVLAWTVVGMIGSFVQMGISSTVMVSFNCCFFMMLLLLCIPSVIVEKRYTGKMYDWTRNRAPEERKMEYVTYIVTDKSYIKDVRLYGIFDNMFERYMLLWNKWYKEKKQWSIKKNIYLTILSLLPEAGLIAVTIYICYEILSGKLTVGDFELFTSMAVQLVSSIWALSDIISKVYEYDMRVTNYKKFMSRKNKIVDDGKLIPSLYPEIEFRNVSFKYPYTDKYILKNMSFVIHSKEKVALVGVNGSGKTTIIKLILRFYDVDEGEILIDGKNIKEFKINELRKVFGVMFQDYMTYAFSAKDNVILSDIENSEDKDSFEKAIRISGLDKLSEKWEKGFDTYLTKQFDNEGQELSGGEWQKVALARAFFRKSRIVILDEPNSAMDAESEHKVFKQYKQLLDESGAILISHRFANIKIANRIFVVENGAIIESGTHNELLKLGGRYAYLYNLQTEGYIDEK